MCFKRSVPDMGTKTKYIVIINHRIIKGHQKMFWSCGSLCYPHYGDGSTEETQKLRMEGGRAHSGEERHRNQRRSTVLHDMALPPLFWEIGTVSRAPPPTSSSLLYLGIVFSSTLIEKCKGYLGKTIYFVTSSSEPSWSQCF